MNKLTIAKNYRFTVYKVSGRGKAEFLEYLNHDELDTWMNNFKTKFPQVVVVNNEGVWVYYQQPNGEDYEKTDSGKSFNHEWRFSYNKPADVDGPDPNYATKAKEDLHEITLRIRPGTEEALLRLLSEIKHRSDPGHSFAIIVDPDDPDGEPGNCGFDGDGRDHIAEILFNGKLHEQVEK